MNLPPAQLDRHLAGTLGALYVVHGDDPLLVLESADVIRAAARQAGFDERELLVVSQGFRWDALHAAADNLSLFGSRTLIDLRIPTGKPGRDGGEALQRHAQRAGSDTLTLITLPELDWATRKSAWFRALDAAGVTVELKAPTRDRLPAWIAARLERQGQSAPTDALEFIADHVEGNLLAAHQEILKLGLLHPEGPLTIEHVRDAVLSVARYDIDDLRAALLAGDTARCMRLLEGLRAEGTAPPLVVWALATEVRTLAALCSGRESGQPLSAIFKAERVFDDARRRTLQHAMTRFRGPELHAALMHAARIDRIFKGVADGDPWEECRTLLLRVTRR